MSMTATKPITTKPTAMRGTVVAVRSARHPDNPPRASLRGSHYGQVPRAAPALQE